MRARSGLRNVVPTAGGADADFVDGAVNASQTPERDLSVQLSGWMLMEAAHTLSTDSEPDPVPDPAPDADPEPQEEE